MKIGILTFHCAHNFGAVLQAFALQSQLQLMGYDVEIINYRPKYLDRGFPKLHKWMFSIGNLKNTIFRYFRIIRKEQKSYIKYGLFEKRYLKLSDLCQNKDDIAKIIDNLDCLILGSDQIWNEKFNGNDDIWLGNFQHFKGKIITYAASAGNNEFSDDWRSKIEKALHKYASISVRESFLIPKLQNIIGNNINIKTVLDPTLMVKPEIWNKFKDNDYNYRYILCYQARRSDDIYRIAKNLANQLKAKVISVDFWDNSFNSNITNAIVSPNEFVSMIKNAQCVVTTSFHGTAFSIICEKPFYTLKLHDDGDGRIENLLNLLGLTDRMIDKSSSPQFSECNYKTANDKLSYLRNLSQEYLKESLFN